MAESLHCYDRTLYVFHGQEESIPYDLAQNYHFVEEPKKVMYICVSSIVNFIFKSEEIMNKIVSLHLPDIYEFQMVEEWEFIVKEVEEKVVKYIFPYKFPHQFRHLVKEVVSFSASEIYIFLLKNRIFDRRLFLKNFVYTFQGTINTYQTVLEILKNDYLEKELKFEIACYYFVETSIVKDCYQKIPSSSHNEYLTSRDIEINKKVPIFYWYYRLKHITTDQLKGFLNDFFIGKLRPGLENFNENLCSFKVLLVWAVYYVNETAVSYLCRIKTKKIIPKDFIKYFLLRNSVGTVHQILSNIYMYLYFDNKCKDLEFFGIQERGFLKMIISSDRWICLLFEFLGNFHYEDEYLFIFQNIVDNLCMMLRKKRLSENYKETLKRFMTRIPYKAKDHLMNVERKGYFALIQLLLNEKDKESIHFFLDFGNNDIFFDNTHFFSRLLENAEFTWIDQCIEGILPSDAAIKLKRKIFIENRQLFSKFILEDSWSSLNLFLKWGSSFLSFSELIYLKSLISYDFDGDVIRGILFNSYFEIKVCKFEFANKVLFWCYGSKDLVLLYKKRAILGITEFENTRDSPLYYYRKNNFLIATELQNANHFVDFYYDIKKCIEKCEWKFLNKLFLWASCSPEEVKIVKQKLKNDVEFLENICKKKNIKFLQSFVKWCEGNVTNQFGKELFLRYGKHVNQTIKCNCPLVILKNN